MRRDMRRRRVVADLEEGWDDSALGAGPPKETRDRSSIDLDILELQSGWCSGTKAKQKLPKHLRQSRPFAPASRGAAEHEGGDEDDEDNEGTKHLRPGRGVKSGALNYDAPLFLKAIKTFDEESKRRAPGKPLAGGSFLGSRGVAKAGARIPALQLTAGPDDVPSFQRSAQARAHDPVRPSGRTFGADRSGSKSFLGGAGGAGGRVNPPLVDRAPPPCAKKEVRTYAAASEDDAFWAEWKSKWDFVYDFVDAEKERKKEEERLKRLGQHVSLFSQKQQAKSHMSGGLPPFRAHNNDTYSSSSSTSSASSEWRDVRDLPDYPPNSGRSSHRRVPPKAAAAPPLVAKPRSKPAMSWASFEEHLRSAPSIAVDDIPFPDPGQPVIGLASSASSGEAKKLVRSALLRWHPDKFQKVLAKVLNPAERARAVVLVQEVARRIIAEKEAAGV